MTRVLCVTPNVALDRVLRVPGFGPGGVWRAAEVAVGAGGKGVNVARALHRLGRPAVVAGLLGGGTGDLVANLVAEAGVAARWTRIGGETRTSTIVTDGRGGSTVVNEPGPVLDRGDWHRFVDDVGDLATGAAAICISGSLPAGVVPAAAIRLLLEAVRPAGVPVWVDSSGAALSEAIAAGVYGIKVNADEAAAAVGGRIADGGDALIAAGKMRDRGAGRVAITMGPSGAVFADETGAWQAKSPPFPALNPTGGGDCFLAGLLAALTADDGPEAALRLAIACGSANAATLAVGDINEILVGERLPTVSLRRLLG